MIYKKIRHVRSISFRKVTWGETTVFDTFYTLSTDQVLLYVSEVIQLEDDPNFQLVSLPKLGNELKLLVSLYAANRVQKEWNEIKRYAIDLNTDLVQIPSSYVDETTDGLKKNSIILKLSNDQYYTVRKRLAKPISADTIPTSPHQVKPSYTFDSIRSTNNIYKSNQELTAIKVKLAGQIDENINREDKVDVVSVGDLSALDKFLNKQRLINDTISAQIIKRKVAINETKQFISNLRANEYTDNQIEFVNSQVEPLHEQETNTIYPETMKQLKNFAEVILEVFTIENVDNSVKFRIQGIEFPSTIKQLLDSCYYDEGDTNETVIRVDAALSYISQMMLVLATITRSNLKYAIHWEEDKCYITDRSTSGTFPLFYNPLLNEKVPIPKGKSCIRSHYIKNPTFEFGLSLLNRNLMLLIHHANELYQQFSRGEGAGKRTVDLQLSIPIECFDNFLWNLQYLVLFLTAS